MTLEESNIDSVTAPLEFPQTDIRTRLYLEIISILARVDRLKLSIHREAHYVGHTLLSLEFGQQNLLDLEIWRILSLITSAIDDHVHKEEKDPSELQRLTEAAYAARNILIESGLNEETINKMIARFEASIFLLSMSQNRGAAKTEIERILGRKMKLPDPTTRMLLFEPADMAFAGAQQREIIDYIDQTVKSLEDKAQKEIGEELARIREINRIRNFQRIATLWAVENLVK